MARPPRPCWWRTGERRRPQLVLQERSGPHRVVSCVGTAGTGSSGDVDCFGFSASVSTSIVSLALPNGVVSELQANTLVRASSPPGPAAAPPSRRRPTLLVAVRLHPGRAIRGDPALIDEPGDKPDDGVVLGGVRDLLFGSVLQVVVFGSVRVHPPDLGVDQVAPLPSSPVDRILTDREGGGTSVPSTVTPGMP